MPLISRRAKVIIILPFSCMLFSLGVPPSLFVALCSHHPRRHVIRCSSQEVKYFCTLPSFFVQALAIPPPYPSRGAAAWTIIFFYSCDLIIEEEHNPQPNMVSPSPTPRGGGSVNPGRCMSVHLALMACQNFKSFCVLFLPQFRLNDSIIPPMSTKPLPYCRGDCNPQISQTIIWLGAK